jgi:hypothetical protein
MTEPETVRHAPEVQAPPARRASLTALLRKAGNGSPLVAPVVYVAGLIVSNTAAAAVAPNIVSVLIMLAIWPAVSLFLFVVVTWFRDDDWLAAGFLIGIPVLLGGFIADIVAQTVVGLSVGAAVLRAPSAILVVGLRSIIFVPFCGGVVTLARSITKRVRRRAA